MSISISKIEPIGRSIHRGFGHTADGSPIYEWWDDDYPPLSDEARAFRDTRVNVLKLGLREAAAMLGISVVDLSSLERGRATCDWVEATACISGETFKQE